MRGGGFSATTSSCRYYIAFCCKLITQTHRISTMWLWKTGRKKGITLNFCKCVIIVILSKRYDANVPHFLWLHNGERKWEHGAKAEKWKQLQTKTKVFAWWWSKAWVDDYVTERILAAPKHTHTFILWGASNTIQNFQAREQIMTASIHNFPHIKCE